MAAGLQITRFPRHPGAGKHPQSKKFGGIKKGCNFA